MIKIFIIVFSVIKSYYIDSYNNIIIKNIDNKNYIIQYNDSSYQAIYTYDNWKIVDSYKIDNELDMRIICYKLTNIHPIHSIDRKGYRTIDDLVYEWKQHNLAYKLLPNNNKYKLNAKDVDLNPDDQNKNYLEILESREG